MGRLFGVFSFPYTAFAVGRAGSRHVAGIADKVLGEIFAEEFGHDLELLHEVFFEGFTAFNTVRGHKENRGRLRSGENRPLNRHPRMVGPNC